MGLKAIAKFVWLFFTGSTEATRQAEIDAVGGGMQTPPAPKK